jgi:parallel beta-helix repeat protein
VRFNKGGGIGLDDADGNRLQSNNASNTERTGIELKDAFANILALNLATANKARGIYVDADADAIRPRHGTEPARP